MELKEVSTKVYKVSTVLLGDNTFASYVVLAKDMKEAVEKVLIICDEEKPNEVEFITRIDIE